MANGWEDVGVVGLQGWQGVQVSVWVCCLVVGLGGEGTRTVGDSKRCDHRQQ